MTTAIVLAGGLGTRLRSAVPDLPKPMAPVAGEPFLAHLLNYWIAQGVTRFVLSVGYRHEAISACFGRRWQGAAIDYVVEETPRGTGGALLLAAESVSSQERFLLLNGDTFFAVDLPGLQRFAEVREADWCFSLFHQSDDARYLGIGIDSDGRILDLGRPGRHQPLANGGVYLVHPRSLEQAATLLRKRSGNRRLLKPEAAPVLSLENDLFPAFLVTGQRLYGRPCHASFIDIGVPDDWRRADTVLPAFAPTEAMHD
jgi:D-glycero-alpha-D-manno-heptose 1-phosphate guanylyltransferase